MPRERTTDELLYHLRSSHQRESFLSESRRIEIDIEHTPFGEAAPVDSRLDDTDVPLDDVDTSDLHFLANLLAEGVHDELPSVGFFPTHEEQMSDPAAASLAAEIADTLTQGALALGMVEGGLADGAPIYALVHGALGADEPASRLRRRLGRPDPLDPGNGGWEPNFAAGLLRDLETPERKLLLLGLVDALHAYARAAAAAAAAADANPPTADANGIQELHPNEGRANQLVSIVGAGFGDEQPVGVGILFPTIGGGCTQAQVEHGGWSDTLVTVSVPPLVGLGTVGFLRPPNGGGPTPDPGDVMAAAGALGAVLREALGPIGFAAAQRLEGRLTPITEVPCPPGAEGDPNWFRGGPELVGVVPARARVGDLIALSGHGFQNGDRVQIGTISVTPVEVAVSRISARVPPAAGGAHRVRVLGPAGEVSNDLFIAVTPQILDLRPARIRPGRQIEVRGTGFVAGARVWIGDTEEPTVPSATLPPESGLRFQAVRPASAPRNPAGEPVTVRVALPGGWVSNSANLTLDTWRLVACGDSVMWGQGLRSEQKFTSLARRHIEERFATTTPTGVYLTLQAHSGATIEDPNDPGGREPLPGEVPTSYPTISEQVEVWTARADDAAQVECVLLNGGINDMGIFTLLDPFQSTTTLEDLAERYCYERMRGMLDKALPLFANARVLVLGYYPIVSRESSAGLVIAALVALGLLGAPVGAALGALYRQRLTVNSDVFTRRANDALRRAVDEANTLRGRRQAVFVNPGFGAKNALFAQESWLWELAPALSPGALGLTSGAIDPMADEREAACAAAPADRRPTYCNIASFGHPNARGARAYFRAIAPHLP